MRKRNYKILIADTSCLIIVLKIKAAYILHELFEEVYITDDIHKELGFAKPQWLHLLNPNDTKLQEALELEIDKGEASALALFYDLDNAVIALDDLKARRVAKKLNIPFTGTFGLLLKAKEMGIIKQVKPFLQKIKATNFRYSEALYQTVLKQAGESP